MKSNNIGILFLIFIITITLLINISHANVLEKERQSIYKISFWQGSKFIDTFAPSSIDDVYLLANGILY